MVKAQHSKAFFTIFGKVRARHLAGAAGFSLLELLVTLAVLGLIVAVGVPSMLQLYRQSQLQGVAQDTYALLQYARSDAIASGETRFVVWQGAGANWCAAVATAADCDCLASDCAINGVARVLQATGYATVGLQSAVFAGGSYTAFDGMRGLAEGNAGTVAFGYRDNTPPSEVRAIVSTLGRVRLCQTADTNAGYPTC